MPVEVFQNSMAYLIRQHLPTKKVRRHTTDKPWATDHFRYLIIWRQYAYMSGNTTLFRSLRNIVIREAKTIRATYYHQRIQLLRNCDPHRWWKHTKAITGLGKTTNEFVAIANALCDGKMSSLAEEINLFFESVCSELNPLDMGTLPTNCRVPVTYIINTDRVTKLLNAIKINKAIGPDDIPNWILRDHAINLAPPICAIFNDSIREGYIPALWNYATVIPIPKVTPARKIEEDLRPISLTAVLSKQLESIVGGWILDIIVDKLDVRQYGGMKGLSTTHALVDMVHNWLVAADKRMASHVVRLDYRKAFDHVDHTVLVNKCKMYGLPGFIIRWIGYFLSDRSQRVRLGQELSDWVHLKGSIPQGTWLGPLLFVILINDLCPPCATHKYMDDTTLTVRVGKGSVSSMQSIMDFTTSWSSLTTWFPTLEKRKTWSSVSINNQQLSRL